MSSSEPTEITPLLDNTESSEFTDRQIPDSRSGNDHTESDTEKTTFWSWKLIGLIIAIVVSCVILAGCIATGLSYYFTQNKYYETVNVNIGGKVPVKINSSDFDSHDFKGVKVSLANITNSSITVYYHGGSCDDIKSRTTVLPSNSLYIHSNASIPYQVNYYNDTPIYALAGTSISYSISVSTNSSQQGCVYLYLFNTASSYQLFLNRLNFTYYNKSDCINTTIGTHKPTNLTILLKEDMFLYSGIIANVSSNINVTISGYRQEYDVSLVESVSVYDTTEIKFCNSGPCRFGLKGGKHCILMMSPVNVTISYENEAVDISPRAFILFITAIGTFAFLLILISVLIFAAYVIKLRNSEDSSRLSTQVDESNNVPANFPNSPTEQTDTLQHPSRDGDGGISASTDLIVDTGNNDVPYLSSTLQQVERDGNTQLTTERANPPHINDILNKEPDTNDILSICHSYTSTLNTDELAQRLGLDRNERMEIQNPPRLPNPLEVAVEKWRQRQPSPVTWMTFRTALTKMGRIDLAQKVNEFLRENFDEYCDRKDFETFSSTN